MPPRDRSAGRDVHFYDASYPTIELGGLILTNGVTNRNFYSMLDILVAPTLPLLVHEDQSFFFLQGNDGSRLEKNDDPLQPGKYYIVAAGGFLSLFLSPVTKS
jgi:hypothetical protein